MKKKKKHHLFLLCVNKAVTHHLFTAAVELTINLRSEVTADGPRIFNVWFGDWVLDIISLCSVFGSRPLCCGGVGKKESPSDRTNTGHQTSGKSPV